MPPPFSLLPDSLKGIKIKMRQEVIEEKKIASSRSSGIGCGIDLVVEGRYRPDDVFEALSFGSGRSICNFCH